MAVLIALFTPLIPWLDEDHPPSRPLPDVRLPEEWTWRREADVAIRYLLADISPGLALHGAGGFGKTSLAKAISNDRRIRAHFQGGVVWTEVGQPRGRGGSEVLASIHPAEEDESSKYGNQLTDVGRLSGHIGELLDKRGRVLVVVDDVWSESQLEPFLALGDRVRLLVTTQKPGVLPRRMKRIPVGALPPEAARRMLTGELPKLSHEFQDRLLELTHRWPQLLSLVIRRLVTDVERGANANRAAQKVIDQFAEAGITAWDIDDSGMRTTAVRATIEYSLRVLSKDARTRFLELGIFAPDVDVPLETVADLWHVTAGLSKARAERLCDDFAGLSLLTLRWIEDRLVITLSRTIRLFSLSPTVLGAEQRVQLNRSFLDAARRTPWWSLPPEHFLWDQLAYHLAEADRQAELTALVTNLDWVLARLERSGRWALESDLGFSTAEETAEIRPLIARVGHLLGDLGGGELTRGNRRTHLSALPGFRAQVERTASAERPDLLPLLPLPESRDSDSIRTLHAHHDVVTAVAIMDGGRLVTGYRDGTVCVWDIDKGTPIRRLEGHTAAVTAIATAHEGPLLATASADRSIRLWDWEEGTARAVCAGHDRAVTGVSIAADGTWLASSSEDGTVRGWDMRGGQRGAIKVQSAGSVNAVAISPESTWFATASMDGKVRLWYFNGTPMVELAAHEQAATTLAISPDGKRVVSGSRDATVRVSDTEGSTSKVLSGHTDVVDAVAVSPDGTWAASASADGTVRMWYPAEGAAGRIFRGHNGPVTALAISPDGSRLASASGGTVCIWDTTAAAGITASEHIGTVFGVGADPRGKWLVSGSDDATVRLWNVKDGRQVAVLEGHNEAVTSVAVAPDGTWLASASADRTLRLWQVAGDREPLVLRGHTRSVNAVAIAPDGKWLVSAADDVHVRMWNARRGTEQRRMTGYNGWVQAVAVSPDGKWLASAYMQGQGVRLWYTDGTLKGNVLGRHPGVVTAIAIAPDASFVAAAFLDDHSVQFWNADGLDRGELTGHSDRIKAVAISPDGAWLATASLDMTIRVWETGENARCVAVVQCGGTMYDVCWGSSRMLIAGGARGLYVFTLSGTPES